MKNTIINRKIIQKVASALGELNSQVVYVGGATVSLYIDDPAAEVKDFLLEQLQAIKDSPTLQKAMLVNLFYETQEERLQLILEKIEACLKV